MVLSLLQPSHPATCGDLRLHHKWQQCHKDQRYHEHSPPGESRVCSRACVPLRAHAQPCEIKTPQMCCPVVDDLAWGAERDLCMPPIQGKLQLNVCVTACAHRTYTWARTRTPVHIKHAGKAQERSVNSGQLWGRKLRDGGSEAPPHSHPYPPSHSEHVGPCAWKASSVIIFSPMFSYAKNGAAERVTSAPAVCAAYAVGPGWLGCGLWFMSLRGAGAAPAQRAF